MPAPRPDTAAAITLRPATVEDAGEVLTLQLAAWLDEGRRHQTFDLPPLTQTLDGVREDLRTQTALVAIHAVAGRGDRVVGTVRAHLLDPGRWYIGRLGVVPDMHGHGIGTRLLGRVEELAPASATRLVLTTGPKSPDNIAFYQRHGYRQVAPDESVGPLHIVHLRKQIQPKERS